MKILYDIDVLPVGKHKGKTVAELMITNPSYLARFKQTNVAIADIVLSEIHIGLRNRGMKLIGTVNVLKGL